MNRYLRTVLIFLFTVLFGGSGVLNAQTVPWDELASGFWGRIHPGDPGFHVDRAVQSGSVVILERLHPKSFLILKPVNNRYDLLAYSDRNLFTGHPDKGREQSSLLEAIAAAGAPSGGRLKEAGAGGAVGPLIRSQWGQGSFYNYYCPRDAGGPNGRVYVGCVAVAMGQVIRYYERFNGFRFHHSYNSGLYGTLNADLGAYHWEEMEDQPMTVNLEVSDLLSDLGVLLHMSYGASGSSANSHRTLEAFHELGYDNATLLIRSSFTAEAWTEVFYQNLAQYKPVLVTGGGHAFVCDGFDNDGYFHFNLGWDGYGDGYYTLQGVMNLQVKEAFTGLEPVSSPAPPTRILKNPAHSANNICWHYDSGQFPLLSRIYVDGNLFMETTDTLFEIGQLKPGTHRISVSALYPEGESRWIGPVDAFVPGKPLAITDVRLYAILQNALGHILSDTQIVTIFEGDLSNIISLDIDQPVRNMESIRLCNHLKRLVIHGFPGLVQDAGPLENLNELKILEFDDCSLIQAERIGSLHGLTELRFRNTPLDDLKCLSGCNRLMNFEYSGSPVVSPETVTGFSLLTSLSLHSTGLEDAGFLTGLPELLRVDLSDNRLTSMDVLNEIPGLVSLDLSGNRLERLTLSTGLASLRSLDASHNRIASIMITATLTRLEKLDLSKNLLASPGRLFLYTPVLRELNLSQNRIDRMGRNRSPGLETLDVSDNRLILTDWISLQPMLRVLNLEGNRISDLSGLLANRLLSQFRFIGLDRNPVSKESFINTLPVLRERVDSVSAPVSYQPLSPCYIKPVNGSRMTGQDTELSWFTENPGKACRFDLYMLQEDTLAPFISDLDTCRILLNQLPGQSFGWVVATRTADTVFYSGVNTLTSTTGWSLPFEEGFEQYADGPTFAIKSDYWILRSDHLETNLPSEVVSSVSHSGWKSLAVNGPETVVLPTGHLLLPYISIGFSVWVPPGRSGEIRIQNMNGMYFRFTWDASGTGWLYVNDNPCKSYPVRTGQWSNFEILGHARNNNYFVRVDGKLLVNQSWQVPEGVIRTEGIEFSGSFDDGRPPVEDNIFYIDDISVTSDPSVTGIPDSRPADEQVRVYPNPFDDRIEVTLPAGGRIPVTVLDINGREVFRSRVDGVAGSTQTILTGDWVPGVYYLRVQDFTRKMIKL